MFYCDFCRAAYKWPRSAGWPYMGVSRGKCEMCDTVEYCHDVPSQHLPDAQYIYESVMKECTECGVRRVHKKDDYVCVFCRGEVALPDPHKEIHEADATAKARIDDLLDKYRTSR